MAEQPDQQKRHAPAAGDAAGAAPRAQAGAGAEPEPQPYVLAIRKWLQRNHVRNVALAGRAGIGRSTLGHIFAGREPSDFTLDKLAASTKLPLAQMRRDQRVAAQARPAPQPSDYATDPVAFVRDVLGDAGRPYSKQVELFEAVARHRRVSVVGCNGSGKDWAAARVVLWWLATHRRAKAVVTGPTQRQVEEVLWREMRTAFGAARDRLPGQMYTARYVIDDDRFALGFATNHPYNLQGFHSPNLLVVVTEAHAVGQEHMDALKRLNPKRLLLTGNPLTLSGEFYDSHHRKASLYARVAISAFDTPNLQQGRDDAVPGMLTPEDVEERRRDWGETHPLYVASVLGQFPEALEDSLISRKQLDEAVERWHLSSAETGKPWIMGVDVARFGSDKTVLCLRRGGRVERIHELRGASTMQTAGHVLEYVRRHDVKAVFVDAAGVGGGVVDRLKELEQPVVEVQVGGAASNPSRFINLRAEIFWDLRRRFLSGTIAIPDDAELAGQLLALRYDIASSGRIQLQSKADLRAKGQASPDRADALALAFMAPASMDVWV
ncbi:MAG: helix-turn-helix transcriptional regulator [Chloroflexi bacterium]|nr:helix-turn-helix transcriptional regulator [Chloroflexota bacterium]